MVEGLRREAARLDLLAHNLANLGTAAFRASGAGVREGEFTTWLDPRPGPVEATGRALDVALPPGVFLAVSTPAGIRYTRRGDLRVEPGGRLVTGAGHPVLSPEQEEIRLPAGPAAVTPGGGVQVAGREVARLGRFRLEAVAEPGGTLFTPAAGAEVRPEEADLLPGSLERSNVAFEEEMVELTAALRRAEMFGLFARVQDETLGRAIQELGRSQ